MPATQFITDNTGKKLAVVLPIKDYQELIEELEDLEDVKAFDEAKKEDDGSRISLEDYVKSRKANPNNV